MLPTRCPECGTKQSVVSHTYDFGTPFERRTVWCERQGCTFFESTKSLTLAEYIEKAQARERAMGVHSFSLVTPRAYSFSFVES